jgi:hypothetical protein
VPASIIVAPVDILALFKPWFFQPDSGRSEEDLLHRTRDAQA